jgi:hypothetical protein
VSGRVHVQHPDGHVTVGYRKTQRRQSPPTPTYVRPDLRLNFLLPPKLRGFVSRGCHGVGVEVLFDATVSIRRKTWNREELFAMAAEFLRAITPRGTYPYSVAVDMTSSSEPSTWRMRWRVGYSDGHVFAAITPTEPLLFPVPA